MAFVQRALVTNALVLMLAAAGSPATAEPPSTPGTPGRPAGPGRPHVPAGRPPVDVTTRGIDVSHYQGDIDWARVAASGHRFVFAKATEGRHYVDPTYLDNKTEAEQQGLAFGAYHFAEPERGHGNVRLDAIREANHFIDEARLRPGNLLPVLDLETTGGLNHRQLTRWILAWLRQVRERLGVRPIVYTSPTGWELRTGDSAAIAQAGFEQLWVAHWGVDAPELPADRWNGHGWTFWQRSACGSVPGIEGCVDLDVAARSLDVATIPTGFDTIAPSARVVGPEDVDGEIAVVFDEPVAGLSRATVRLRGATAAVSPRVRLECRTDYGTVISCETTGVDEVDLVPVEPLVPGEIYDVVVDDAITDLSGNPVERDVEAVAPPLDLSQGSAAVAYSWAEVSRDNALGDSYVVERRPGATATFAFHGSSVTWFTAKGPDMGRAAISIDGALVAQLDLRAERAAFGVAHRFDGFGPGRHTLRVVVLGRGADHPREAPIVIDGFRTGHGVDGSPRLEATWAVRRAGLERHRASAIAGASAEVTFFGSAITWHTVTGPAHGRAALWLDGRFLRTVDAGSAVRAVRLERVGGLTAALHTLRIVVLGSSAASVGVVPAVSVDGFVVER